MVMAALEDEETQKRGVLSIVFSLKPHPIDPVVLLKLARQRKTLPTRQMGNHICTGDIFSHRVLATLIKVGLEQKGRVRVRFHRGKFFSRCEK
jgi:hypothetical protein